MRVLVIELERRPELREIVYEHPTTGERVKSHDIAAMKAEARKKARESNIQDEISRRFWKIVSVKEVTL